MTKKSEIAVVLLAAGASMRLGQPKQLLFYDGSKLIHRSIKAAHACKATHRIVVLGAYHQLIGREIKDSEIQIVVNEQWKEGMASSIRSGLTHAIQHWPSLGAALFMVCDQPAVDSHHLDSLINKYGNSDSPVVASQYKGIYGVPAIFDRSVFPLLLNLKGDMGARKIIETHRSVADGVILVEGDLDIDRKEDINR